MRFMLLVGSSAWRAKLLLADLQAQLSANERILRDFGPQIQYGHWRDGMFETQDGCYFMALGLNQPFRGLRRYANRIDFAVVDDIEDRKRVVNQSLIAARVDKILGRAGYSFSQRPATPRHRKQLHHTRRRHRRSTKASTRQAPRTHFQSRSHRQARQV